MNNEDNIYEGGESIPNENQGRSQNADVTNAEHHLLLPKNIESSDEEIDPMQEEDPIKRGTKKMKHLEDWRETCNFFIAYFTRRLRTNDY